MYNLKIAIRNLQRNGLYSWINVVGLAVSLTACILIALWAEDELSYDRFHRNADNLYKIHYDAGERSYWGAVPVPMAAAIRREVPEALDVCRVEFYYDAEYLQYNHTKFFDLQGYAVDASFFTMFDFPLLEGDVHNPFPDDASIIVSETKAKVFFGDKSPIGEIITLGDTLLFHVTGVIKDAPHNSSQQFDYLIPLNALQKTYGGNGDCTSIHDDWGWFRCRTFLLLRAGEDIKALEEKMSRITTQIRRAEPWYVEKQEDKFLLQPLLESHLYRADGEPEGMKTVYLLSLVMTLIMLVACINYVNLITARATKRSKEMAVRKIMGATKAALFFQLIREMLVLLVVTLTVASFLIYFLLPVYNELSGKNLLFEFTNTSVWLIYAIMAGVVLVLAGLYPAFLLSAFQPMDAFRGAAGGKKRGVYLRKTLVVLQFAISFGLIVVTITIGGQIKYMREKDLGYDKENIFTMEGEGEMTKHPEAIRNELLRNENIVDVTVASTSNMMAGMRRNVSWQGKPEDFNPYFYGIYANPDFCDFMHIPLVQGEPLSASDERTILVNEEAVRIMEMDNPVGQLLYMSKTMANEAPHTIKGVVKDFHFLALHEKMQPLIIYLHNPRYSYPVFYIKTTGINTQSALSAAEKVWKQYNPEREFTYDFLDETFEYIYETEIYMGRLLMLFAVIAVFISCIGLFGLVTYMAESKTKEIGVRKVMGAGVTDIISMLSKEFLWLVGVGMVIAIPVTYYYLHQLLQQYAYRISLSWLLFAAGAGVIFLLTLLSVGFKAFRAATANPVDAIKTE
ncbi:MAG: ABC transporter permease [Prevotellaceae bacterium]|jgi:predicted permease|nr:ABC transporter permease [Prevotellaceae bacterium]